ELPVRTESDVHGVVWALGQHLHFLAARHLPEMDRGVVRASGGQGLSIQAEADSQRALAGAIESMQFRTRGRVAELDELITPDIHTSPPALSPVPQASTLPSGLSAATWTG